MIVPTKYVSILAYSLNAEGNLNQSHMVLQEY